MGTRLSREARAAGFGWALSLVLHAALAIYLHGSTQLPELGFEFALPDEVEFGLTDSITVSAGASAPAVSPPAGEGSEGSEGTPTDGGVPDAGPPDAGRPRVARPTPPEPAEGHTDEGTGTGDAEGEGRGVAFLEAGAQIALRLDITRIRESPIAEEVRGFLAVLPDWRNVLGDSGIDPLVDLDRLLVASPNLDRSRMILAGRTVGDADRIRAAAQALSTSAGQGPLAWREQDGVAVADWHDPSEVERVIAIVGPRHFVVCRPVDLPRVLAVASARANRTEDEGGEAEHPADALLSMEEGEGLSIEIEGARSFTRSSRPVEVLPLRARFAMRAGEAGTIAIRSGWHYEDAPRAEAAATYWNRIREGYAANIIVRSLGLGPILGRATLAAEEERVDAAVDLELAEMRRLLNLGMMVMGQRAAAPPGPAPGEPDPGGLPPGGASPGGPSPGAPPLERDGPPPVGPRPPPSPY